MTAAMRALLPHAGQAQLGKAKSLPVFKAGCSEAQLFLQSKSCTAGSAVPCEYPLKVCSVKIRTVYKFMKKEGLGLCGWLCFKR